MNGEWDHDTNGASNGINGVKSIKPQGMSFNNLKDVVEHTAKSPGIRLKTPKSTARVGLSKHVTQQWPSDVDGQTNGFTKSSDEDKMAIAVVGMAIRLPGDATSAEKFWEMLVEGRSAKTEVPKSRYNVDAHYRGDTSLSESLKVRSAHFLRQDIGAFDAPFFSINPNEAMCIDPQQRLLLETTYEAFENAGFALENVAGSSTSVFIGAFGRDYDQLHCTDPLHEVKYKATGTAISMAANRLSWFYNLTGPSVTLDTACSSSLTALHLACQTLRDGASRMAVVGGSNLIIGPESSIGLGKMNCLSPDGISYSFDHRANGYSRGEGIAVVVLKPLPEALSNGDTIRAVIRATGVNQDGHTVDIAQPNQAAQAAMIRDTYASAQLSMEPTRYIEAHGTGTAIGDPIELGSIQSALAKSRCKSDPLYVGAVKSNIGHTEATSGVAGLIKTILVLEKGIIPGNVWFEKPNPRIDLDDGKIRFPTRPTLWPSTGLRRASINSYGFGGTNAHAVLDDAYHYMSQRSLDGIHRTERFPRLENQKPGIVSGKDNSKNVAGVVRQLRIFRWSGADRVAMTRLAKSYQDYFKNVQLSDSQEAAFMSDLAFTLSRRSSLAWKSCLVAENIEDLLKNTADGFRKVTRSVRSPNLGFVFTGQGAQWHAMGNELHTFPVFSQSLQQSAEILDRLGCTWSLLEEMSKNEQTTRVNDPEFAQPISTALQIALVDLLHEVNVTPTAVVGHSSGEIAAAYCKGALSRASALKVAYFRGIATSALRSQPCRDAESMMAVSLSQQEAEEYLERSFDAGAALSVGCINSPSSVTITGSDVNVEKLRSLLDAKGVFARKLKVDVAYHSTSMHKVAGMYRHLIQDLEAREQLTHSTPIMVSTVTGKVIPTRDLTQSDYWVKNLVSPVQFFGAADRGFCGSSKTPTANGVNDSIDFLLEIGPHSTLKGPLREIVQRKSREIGYAPMLVRNTSALSTTLHALADIHAVGYGVDLDSINTRGGTFRQGQLLTTLPAYPFDQSKTYWNESRQSMNSRFAEHPYHDLLGMRVLDWNKLEAKWRSLISIDRWPWVKDHVVLGTPVYPGAGMLVMAIEAARQLTGSDRTITGYRLRDTSISKSLVVPLSGDIEANFFLRPDLDKSNNLIKWHDFRLCSLENGEWSENCRGSIAVELQDSRLADTKQGDPGVSEADLVEASSCDMCLGSKFLYKKLESQGLEYGPSFRTLQQIFSDGTGGAIANLNLSEWKIHRPVPNMQPHVIHPAALDPLFHLSYAALSTTNANLPTAVPTLIRNMWISGSLTAEAPESDQQIIVRTKAKMSGFQNTEFTISGKKISSGEHCIHGEVYCTAVGALGSDSGSHQGYDPICFQLDTKPDLDYLKREEVEAYCCKNIARITLSKDDAQLARLVCLLACTKAQRVVSLHQIPKTKAHLHKFKGWTDSQTTILRQYFLDDTDLMKTLEDDTKDLTKLLDESCNQLSSRDPSCRMIARSAGSLTEVLLGEVDPLELYFHDNLANEYYKHDVESTNIFQQVEVLLDLLAHKGSALRILEVGAGTGSATQHILDACTSNKGTSGQFLRIAEYDFTDIGSSFLEAARTKFKPYAHRMKFSTLDIERDPQEQGFRNGYYDLVISSNVLHATSNLTATLGRVKSLLKPGGRLILHEAVAQGHIMPGFVFGMFPGWWLSSEPEREMSPLLTESRWQDYLITAGFSGVDLALHDDALGDEHSTITQSSVMVSTNPQTDLPRSIKPYILVDKVSETQQALGREIQSIFAAAHYEVPNIVSLEDTLALATESPNFISLLELDQSILYHIDATAFRMVKNLLSAATGVLWVMDNTISEKSPVSSLITGMARTLRAEHDRLKLCTLSLESATDTQALSKHVFQIFCNGLLRNHSDEVEFVEQSGFIHTRRAIQAPFLNTHIYRNTLDQDPENHPFGADSSRRLKLSIGAPGLLDTLHFVDDALPQEVGADEIEMKVCSSGLNFRDILIALGQIDACYLGSECSGVVTQVGSNFKTKFKPGDRVCSMVEGSLKTYARCHAAAAIHIPDSVSFTTAAALPVVFATAYHCLYNVARIQPQEVVLIHSGSGGLGQACIQLAQLKGAEIYTTVGTTSKREAIQERYKIPPDHIFSSRDLSFKTGIINRTHGRGVDIVINSLAGEAMRASWELIAPNGRFIEVGKKDIYKLGSLPMFPFAKMATFSSVDLAQLFQNSPHVVADLCDSVLQLFVKEQITVPAPLQVFAASEIVGAFRLIQSGQSQGKLVINLGEEDIVPIVPSTQPRYDFDSDATYVLSGGLGGLGRSICRWMISRGAKHFLLLSRSGPREPQAKMFLHECQRKGATVLAPKCDISDAARLASVLQEASRHLPPVKGCIQGAMQLNDMRFDQMSAADYLLPMSSKVDGSWNLHKLLPSGLDFFILLASVSGVCGTHGQANYAAANTYQDALAQHRLQHGQRAQVLDLGNFQSIGHWEHLSDELIRTVGAHRYRSIEEAELLAVMDYYCDPTRPLPTAEEAQIFVGLELPSSLNAKGIQEPYWMTAPLFKHLYQMDSRLKKSSTESGTPADILETALASTTSLDDAAALIIDALLDKLSRTLNIERAELESSKSMLAYGVDSLAAVEVRTWFKKVAGAEMAVFEILSNATVEVTGALAAKRSRFVPIKLAEGGEGESASQSA